LLPQCWNGDEVRRARAHVPDHERHHSRWHYLVDAIDEMTHDWEMDPRPVVVDARHDTKIEPLLRALEERGHRYLIRVSAGAMVAPPGGSAVTIGEYVADLGRQRAGNGSTWLNWRNGADGPATTSRFVVQPLRRRTDVTVAYSSARPRQLLLEWLPGQPRPKGLWLTNVRALRLPQLIGLARTPRLIAAELNRLRDDFGLCHFEGRSFRGWHHHMTLVALAHAYALGHRLANDRDTLALQLSPA
jgi:hypothetical protein